MHDVEVVHGLQSLNHLNENPPYEVFFQTFIFQVCLWNGGSLPFQTFHDLAVKIAHVDQLHHDAK